LDPAQRLVVDGFFVTQLDQVSRSVCNTSRANSSKSSENNLLTLSSSGVSQRSCRITVFRIRAQTFNVLAWLASTMRFLETSKRCFVAFSVPVALLFQ